MSSVISELLESSYCIWWLLVPMDVSLILVSTEAFAPCIVYVRMGGCHLGYHTCSFLWSEVLTPRAHNLRFLRISGGEGDEEKPTPAGEEGFNRRTLQRAKWVFLTLFISYLL